MEAHEFKRRQKEEELAMERAFRQRMMEQFRAYEQQERWNVE